QESALQRQAEEEEPIQEFAIQRQSEEEEPLQEMAVQRQEEEEPLQEVALQRQAEEEEPIQEFAIQRQSNEEESVQEMAIQRQEEEPIQELTVQRQDEEEEPDVQRQQEEQVMAKSDEPRAASTTLESRMRSTQSEGASLKDATRAEMESHLETDLSNVKVHSGANAAKMNKELGAQAFTHGNHIYFGEGKYKPDSKEGKRLIAHEVTHTVQQTGGMHKKAANISSAPEKIQRFSLPFADRIADYAAQIPGYTLFTVIIGFDPIRNSSVPRTAINLLRGLFGLIPLGVLLFDKLSELEIVERAFNWVNMELAKLDISLERVNRIIAQAWEDTDFRRLDLIEYNVGVIRRHLAPLYNDVLAFANSAVTTVLGMVKEALLNRLKSFAEGNPAYPLLTQILGRDPITGENVQRNLVVMIESFLQLIGAEEELQKMRETGTIQRVADWLNSELAQLNFSWDEVAELFRQAWGAFSLEDLRDPMGAFQRTVNIFAPFVERVLRFARNVAVKVLEFIKDALLNYLKNFAAELPGYPLFTVILGRDPFTGEIVPRTAENFIRGFLSFVPGGEEKFRNLQESGAIERGMAWLENEIALLDLSWATIRELFTSAWQSLSIRDLMDPVPAFRRMVDLFAEPVQRIIRFAGNVGMKILEFIFEGAMGAGGARVLEILKRGGDTFMLIINDPVAFLGHLLEAVKTGFQQFAGNIWDHLKRGLLGWLFGALQGAGIKLPETFDLKGIVSLVLQILGITYQGIRAKLVKHIGEERVAMLERVFEFVRGIITEGPAYLWNKLLEFVGNIKDMVMGAIQNWVVTRIVQAAITKLATMLNPVGAVIQSIIAIYDTIMFFIERINQILDLVESIVNSITEIATGNIARAANFVEQTMGRTVPVIISFLARLIGLGGISDTIRDIINRIRQPVDKALDRIVAWIVGQARRLLGRGKEGARGDHQQIATEAANELKKTSDQPKDYNTLRDEKQKEAAQIESKYNKRLERGVKLSIRFSEPSKDKFDDDIDFEVIVAPNTIKVSKAVPITPMSAKQAHDKAIQESSRPELLKGHKNYVLGHGGRDFSPQTRSAVDAIGNASGDHSVPSIKSPGTSSGHWIPDHQPPDTLERTGGANITFHFYPHSKSSASSQGGIVNAYKMKMEEFRNRKGKNNWAEGVQSKWFW
ncbi:MAG: hypothetical protein CV087_08180, partial [Candidatus Brocadia sp. WS118]